MRKSLEHTIVGIVLSIILGLWVGPSDLFAQQKSGNSASRAAPFADAVLNKKLVEVLHQMDIFNGDSAMILIGAALSDLNDEAIEERYYLLSYRAEVLYYEGLFNEAMRDLDVAETLAFRMNDSLLIANVFNMKGLLHENIQNGQLAIPFLEKALQWFPRDPRPRYPLTELHHIHGNLGSYLMAVDDSDSAEFHIRRSLALAERSGTPRAIAVAWWTLGNLSLITDQPDSALVYYDRAAVTSRASNDHDVALDALSGKSNALIKLEQYNEARKELDKANTYLSEHLAGIGGATQRSFARQASHAYEALGEPLNALVQTHKWRTLDSMIAARNTNQALSTQAELLKADKDLEVERADRFRIAEVLHQERYERQVWLLGGVLILAVITFIFFANASRQRNMRKLAESETVRAQQEQTIRELQVREQIGRDLHDDLGVGLSGLKLRSEMALRMEKDPFKREQLIKLSDTAGELIGSMRQIIWSMNTDQASVEDLVVYTCNYARTYAAENQLPLTIVAPGPWPVRTLSSEQRRNIFLVIKEALHNVVKHANATSASIHIQVTNDLLIEIQDHGIGMPSGSELGEGNGLRNMRKRIVTLDGSFEITGTNGTHIQCRIPILTATNKGSIA
ncbi:MAG: hypothetical protein KBF87_10765 [Flavobacteriales bacterium]|nr:hypothetical protein [Flavobacteriales bacterium]MBK9536881.1 hypothetical protein [Flavobacteriales bacterium]MBP9138960.1 hypothetical protein [Flavobacteriales bacterium]HQX39608.1 histidine kinase [Flavobacteriales bacterium]HQZ94327.1 histidine kinase [Flavobacteriales bacterium]